MASNGDAATARGAERRVAFRCNVVDVHLVPVDLAFQNGALLLDLSESGMGVQALVKHPNIGSTTDLHFQLPESEVRVSGVGTVAWSDDSGRLGIRFDELAELCRPHLSRWLSRERRSQAATGPLRGIPREDEILVLRHDLREQKILGDEALAFVLERLRSVTSATGAAIAIEHEGAFICRASSGAAPSVGAPLNPAGGLSGECVSTRQVVRCDDTETDARVDRVVCRALHMRAAVIVPVMAQARLVGVLEAFSSHPHAFESSDVLMLREAAELIAELAGSKPALTAAAPAPVAAPDPPAVQEVAATVAAASSASPALASFTMAETPVLQPASELSPAFAAPVAAPRLKFLLGALALTMLAGSAWAGWHWGQFVSMLHHPSMPAASAAPIPAAAPVASTAAATEPHTPIASPANPPIVPPSPAAAAPKASTASKKSAPVLVLAESVSRLDASSSEPPPAIASPVDRSAEAAGLRAVLSTAAAPASLEKPSSVGVTGGKLIRRVEPVYPPSARNLRMSGVIVLKASIDVHGRVSAITVISGSSLLAGAAVNAVRNWRYEPFLLNGVPIPNEVIIRVNFEPRY